VNAGAILYIHLVSHFYKIDIASYHGIKPEAAIIAGYDIANYGGIRRYKIIITKLRELIFYRKYYGHGKSFECYSIFIRLHCKLDKFFASLRTLCVLCGKLLLHLNLREIFLRHVAQTSPAPLALEIVKAEGSLLYDAAGQEYIDLIGGISVANTGHRHPKVIAAIQKQLEAYLHIMVYGEFVETPQVQYAQLLTANLPPSLNCVYFTNSGAEAVEGAMKLAKRFTNRTQVIAFNKSYHGSTQGALSVMGDEYWRNAFRPLLPDVLHLEYGAMKSLDFITTNTACVITETVQAEAGIMAPSKEWMQTLRNKCDETGTLLILDEIQTGFGRTGKLWGFEHFDMVPDIVLLGKALGGGMPLGAFIADKQVMWSFTGDPVLGHITTFGGHPLSCAAGMAAFKVLLEEKLTAEVKKKEELFRFSLTHPKIKSVRSFGLWLAVEFDSFETNKKVIDACVNASGRQERPGALVTDWFLFAPECLRISPPLIIEEAQIKKACDIILQACDSI
jgi:acetylornithine/succinyldiaminopimelate/putrescine aminotransferase